MIYEFKFSPEVVQLIALGLRKLPYEPKAAANGAAEQPQAQ